MNCQIDKLRVILKKLTKKDYYDKINLLYLGKLYSINRRKKFMRDEEITKAIEKEIMERKELAFRKNKEAYDMHKEKYVNAFVSHIDNLFKKYLKLQNVEEAQNMPKGEPRKHKGKLNFICISYLRTSMEDESYEYVVRAYDDFYYLDKIEVEEWYPLEYRRKQLMEDRKYFEKLIFSRIIRVKKYEIKDFLRKYVQEVYCKPLPEEIVDSLEKIQELESYKKIQKCETVIVQYGELMDKVEENFYLKQ